MTLREYIQDFLDRYPDDYDDDNDYREDLTRWVSTDTPPSS